MNLRGWLALLLLFVSGCASSSDLDARLKELKDDMYAEMRNQKSDLQDSLRKEIREVQSDIKKEIVVSQSQITELRANLTKLSLDTDKTLIDHQKQIFQVKAVSDDNARRVYMVESVITARGSVVPQQTIEGFVTFLEDKNVAISLGSIHGIKIGDMFGVYRDQDIIGTIEIIAVERDSSRGSLVEKIRDISVGNRVEYKKK